MSRLVTRRSATVAVALLASVTAALAPGSVPAGAAGERARTVPADRGGGHPRVSELATYVDGPCADDVCGSGSTIGPDGALYVTDSNDGEIQRIDLRRGTVRTYADGLPRQLPGVVGGGVADVAFVGSTAYVLVTGVSRFWTELVGSTTPPAVEGVYRLDRVGSGRTRATLVADLYTWSEEHPPASPDYFIPGGYTYAMEPYGRGLLVTDAHHNRLLEVGVDGSIEVFTDLGQNVVPTGLERLGPAVLVAQAGPVPHVPETGRVVAVWRAGGPVVPLVSGAPLLVDVEVGPVLRMYGLAQGDWPYEGQPGKEGFPAAPNTGELVVAGHDGTFRPLVTGLDRPTTFEVVGDTAYVVTITGKVLRITGIAR